MADDSLKPIDTIRLSPRDKQRLVDEIQRPSRIQSPESERRRLRVDFNGHVVISLKNPDGGTVRYSVTPRNLSSHGLGFIHGQYVHSDRKCEVIIPTLRGEWILTKARISRCKHLAKLIHDVSVVFDQQVTLDDYVALTPEQSLIYHQQSNKTKGGDAVQTVKVADKTPTRLSGNVIVADDAKTDRQLYGMWLSKLGVKPLLAGTQQEIHDALDKQQVDLMLIDLKVGGMSGLEIIQQLRLAAFKGPIIVSCDAETDQVQAQALAAGANAIITKPLDRAMLNEIVEQLLLFNDSEDSGGKGALIRSQLIDDPDMVPFIHSFVTELNSLSELLAQARVDKNEEQLQTVCTRIKCGGASYGFSPLTRMAKLALGQIQHNPSVSASEKALDDLTTMLGRVRA